MSPANKYTGWDKETIVKLAEAFYSDDFNELKDLRDEIDRFSGGTTVDTRLKTRYNTGALLNFGENRQP
ncbi:hypothetical protein PI125_g14811 [Phytophthora idaei]|nr:hypothetical protein PI125_g14811 [Phytophthora idaei]KAG3145001.1 hypothetical protein PI126_g13924 [Phytophthora idaei]